MRSPLLPRWHWPAGPHHRADRAVLRDGGYYRPRPRHAQDPGTVCQRNNEQEKSTKDEKDIEINESFNIYKPIKEGLLAFNISKKMYYIVIPEKYKDFWNEYQIILNAKQVQFQKIILINKILLLI